MSYAIIGFGNIGQALAHAFARRGMDIVVAGRRPPEALAPQARAIGPTVAAKTLQEALEADTIFLAVPFDEHREIAKALPSWGGKTVIDSMNSLAPLAEQGGLLSSALVAKAFAGARVVKGFNHLGAAKLAADPVVEGGHRVVFLASDDEEAIPPVAALAKQLSAAPAAPSSTGACTTPRAPGTDYLIGLVYSTGKIWVSVPADTCLIISNGQYATSEDLRAKVRTAYATRSWS